MSIRRNHVRSCGVIASVAAVIITAGMVLRHILRFEKDPPLFGFAIGATESVSRSQWYCLPPLHDGTGYVFVDIRVNVVAFVKTDGGRIPGGDEIFLGNAFGADKTVVLRGTQYETIVESCRDRLVWIDGERRFICPLKAPVTDKWYRQASSRGDLPSRPLLDAIRELCFKEDIMIIESLNENR